VLVCLVGCLLGWFVIVSSASSSGCWFAGSSGCRHWLVCSLLVGLLVVSFVGCHWFSVCFRLLSRWFVSRCSLVGHVVAARLLFARCRSFVAWFFGWLLVGYCFRQLARCRFAGCWLLLLLLLLPVVCFGLLRFRWLLSVVVAVAVGWFVVIVIIGWLSVIGCRCCWLLLLVV
jgi:hypothetical protein